MRSGAINDCALARRVLLSSNEDKKQNGGNSRLETRTTSKSVQSQVGSPHKNWLSRLSVALLAYAGLKIVRRPSLPTCDASHVNGALGKQRTLFGPADATGSFALAVGKMLPNSGIRWALKKSRRPGKGRPELPCNGKKSEQVLREMNALLVHTGD